MKNNKISAFTLVELIVVITILAVLATVAFISFQGYTSSSRDSVRLTDLKNISKSFEINRTKGIDFPLPDKKVDISSSGTIFQYQGELSQEILNSDLNIFDGGIDPLSGNNYGYAVNSARNKFQIIGFLENQDSVANISINTTFADNSDKYVKSSGDKLGILLDETTNEIISDENNTLEIDIAHTSINYNVSIEGENFELQEGGLGIMIKNSSCKALKQNNPSLPSGEYTIFPDGKNELTVFCDMETSSEAWTGLYYKNGSQTCNNFGNNYTKTQLKNILFSNFGVSDSLESIGVDQSWIIRNIDFEDDVDFYSKLQNLVNCTTPAGTDWTQEYQGGYLFFRGELDTFGGWDQMNTGCAGNLWSIGQYVWLRLGGNVSHTGEFIHSSCNAYNYTNNSVTSRWNDDNIRMFWFQ